MATPSISKTSNEEESITSNEKVKNEEKEEEESEMSLLKKGVIVEYIKENDFVEAKTRKYAPRTVLKPNIKHGMGYSSQSPIKTCKRPAKEMISPIPRNLTKNQIKDLSTKLKTNGVIICPIQGCERSFIYVKHYSRHYKMCKGPSKETCPEFICTFCKGKFISEARLVGHEKICPSQPDYGKCSETIQAEIEQGKSNGSSKHGYTGKTSLNDQTTKDIEKNAAKEKEIFQNSEEAQGKESTEPEQSLCETSTDGSNGGEALKTRPPTRGRGRGKRGRGRGIGSSESEDRIDIGDECENSLIEENCQVSGGNFDAVSPSQIESCFEDSPPIKSTAKVGKPRGRPRGKHRGRGSRIYNKEKGEDSFISDKSLILEENNEGSTLAKFKDSFEDSFSENCSPKEVERGRQVGRPRGRPRGRGRGRKINSSDYLEDLNKDDDHFCTPTEKAATIDLVSDSSTRRSARAKRLNYKELNGDEDDGDRNSRQKSRRVQRHSYAEMDKNEEIEGKVERKGRGRSGEGADLNYMELGKGEGTEEETGEVTTPKGKGLKRKKEEKIKPKKEKEPLICPVCEKETATNEAMKVHVAKEHNRLYMGKGEELVFYPAGIVKLCGQVSCEKCGKVFRFSHYYLFHSRWCGKEDTMTTCKICGKVIRAMYETNHVKSAHSGKGDRSPTPEVKSDAEEGGDPTKKRGTKRKAAQKCSRTIASFMGDKDNEDGPVVDDNNSDDDPDMKVEDLGSEDEDEGEEYIASDDEEERPKTKKRKVSTPANKGQVTCFSKLRIQAEGDNVMSMVTGAYDWTYKARKSMGSEQLFTNWLPKKEEWNALNEDESNKYLPSSLTSPIFTMKYGQKTTCQDEELKRFEARGREYPYFYCGGQIWAAAWLTLPVGMIGPQFIAVYAHRDPERITKLSKPESFPGLVQLWQCGDMLGSTLEEPPCLSFCLAQDFGAVHEMKWCPSRTYQTSNTEVGDGFYRRLGLLALSCSDGKLRVFSVPHPSELTEESVSVKVYKPNPVAILKAEITEPCTAVPYGIDWHRAGDHTEIAAGFSDGTISLWDLGTKSALLRSREEGNNMEVILPYHTFPAHYKVVTSVAFSLHSPEFMISGSHDRDTKTWNLFNTSCVSSVAYRTKVHKVLWPSHWASTLSGGDDCYSFEHNGVFCIDSGYFGIFLRVLNVHNAAIWDISYSDWLNSIVSVDNAGQVTAMCLPSLTAATRAYKNIPNRRLHLMNCYLEPRISTSTVNPSQDTPENRDNGKTLPTSVTEASEERNDSDTKNCAMPSENQLFSKPETREAPSTTVTNKEMDVRWRKGAELGSNGDKSCQPSTSTAQEPGVNEEEEDEEDGEEQCRKLEEMKEKYTVVFQDYHGNKDRRAQKSRLRFPSDLPGDKTLDKASLNALTVCSWNPNLGSHLWLLVAGRSGIVRLHHMSGFESKYGKEFTQKHTYPKENGPPEKSVTLSS